MAMYLKNNERRLPSEVQHHLCYLCGDVFRERHEYQKHLIGHQAFGLIYQIYHFDKTESERKSNEKARKTDAKSGSSLRQSEELEKEMRYRAKGRGRGGVDKLEKSHREERKQYLREKEREEELEAERERQRKIEAARRRREMRKRKLDEHTAMAALRDQAIPIAKRRPPTRERTGDSVPPVSPANPNEPSSSASPPRPATAPQPVLPRNTNTGFYIGPLLKEKCPYCVSKATLYDPVEAIDHIVDHGGSILDVKLVFYEDDKFIATEGQVTGEKCNVCDVTFDFPTQYYLHLLMKHRSDVTAFYLANHPNANNVKIITVIIYRMYPEHTVEFREIIPKPAEVEEGSGDPNRYS